MRAFSTLLAQFLLAQASLAVTIPAASHHAKPTGAPVPLLKPTAEQIALGKKFEQALCKVKHPDITPLDKPVISYEKKATRKPQDYLKHRAGVYGKAAAWQEEFFKTGKTAQALAKPAVAPIRPGAPTVVSLYFPHPNPKSFKGQNVYLERIQRLAKTKEQVIIYVAKSVSAEIKKMRSDPHWVVIDEYATIWDIPNNKFQKANFEGLQRQIFAKMRDLGTEEWRPSKIYDDAFYSAAYNAKAFIAYDAPLRNPFGSDRWVYMDGGLLLTPELPTHPQPPMGADGHPWSMLLGPSGWLDTAKIDRSIKLTKDTGVVFPEYAESHGVIDVTSQAFTVPLFEWQNKYYLGGFFVGNTLGFLNYAVRYMATVDHLDANGRYTGREEFITPIVGAMYPNTVFSQPVQALPPLVADPKLGDTTIRNWKYMLLSYATPYGKALLPEMRDPINGLYCGKATGYKPRGHLAAGAA
jgi:hypothetical protein